MFKKWNTECEVFEQDAADKKLKFSLNWNFYTVGTIIKLVKSLLELS